MSRIRASRLAPLLLVAAGCAAPPLRTVEVGILTNQAVLRYRYAEAEHEVPSGEVEVVVLAPAPALGFREGASATASKARGARSEAEAAESERRGAEERAATQARADLAGQRAAGGRGKADARAAEASRRAAAAAATQAAEAARAGRRERDAASRGAAVTARAGKRVEVARGGSASDARRASLVSLDATAGIQRFAYAASMRAEHRAATTAALALHGKARTGASAARMSSLDRRPVLSKQASRRQVLVGDPLLFVLEVANLSGLPIQAATITDTLDPWLEAEPKRVYAGAGVPVKARREGQTVTITLGRPLARGETVRVYLPTTVRRERGG